MEFFIGLFTSSSPSIPNNLDGLISPSLSQDDIEMLTKIPTADEIKKVVFSMGSNKAPGPDEMLALFFKFYWNVMGGEVIEAVISFFNRRYMLKEINHLFIALIPKGNNAASVNQFRPISLCNVLYKIISKLLTNRLKQVLNKLTSPWQIAFIPGRKSKRTHL